jgi:Tfp pilus assembly protein FimT
MELMMALVVTAIIIAIAVPAYTALIQNNFSQNTANSLIASLKFIRSEAVKRNATISLCATSSSTFAACGSAWATGWFMFIDVNGNGTYDSATDTILRINSLTGTGASILASNSSNTFSYNNLGFPLASTSNITIAVNASNCKGDNARTITISVTGMITSVSATCP